MSAGEMPPDVMAALQQQMGASGQGPREPQAPAPQKVAVGLAEVQQECLRAALEAAKKAVTADDARNDRELGQAALAFAQAYVTLDPTLVSPQGVPPEVLAAAQPVQPAAAEEQGAGE